MEQALLDALRAHTGEWVTEPDLAERIGCTPPDLEQGVEALRAEGYRIESCRSLGYRLLGYGDRLIAQEIMRGLGTRVVGRRVIVLDRTASTNDVAWNEARSGVPEGLVIFSEHQTAGRGRMGRVWNAPPRKALLMSVILRPELDVRQGSLLTVMSAVAVAQALADHLRLQARIRWPNDITIKGRKVAGILVEGRTLPGGAAFVVGIGLNVNAGPEDFSPEVREAATSLAIELQQSADRMDVARWVLRALERWYRDVRFGDYGRIAQRWRELSSTLGQRVVLMADGHEFKGRVLDLSLEDGLIVRLDEGVTKVFHPSTVTLRQISAQ